MFVWLGALVILGCNNTAPTPTSTSQSETPTNQTAVSNSNFLTPAAVESTTTSGATIKSYVATITTDKGVIKVRLSDKTPITTGNFIKLTQTNFYDGLTFHRVEPEFVIQGGDPQGNGTGGSDETIKLEIPCTDGTTVVGQVASPSCTPAIPHDRAGTISMARTSDPNSATSQFFITLAPTPFLDRQYAAFGYVVEGLDVVNKIAVGDKMNKVTVEEEK